MNTILRKLVLSFLALALLTLFTVFATSCSTARGFGRDVGHLGEGIERAAR